MSESDEYSNRLDAQIMNALLAVEAMGRSKALEEAAKIAEQGWKEEEKNARGALRYPRTDYCAQDIARSIRALATIDQEKEESANER